MGLKVAHVGSYFELDNDIVKQMYRSLASFSDLSVTEYDLGIYGKSWFLRYKNGPKSTICIRNFILNRIIKSGPDIIILNAGRQSFTRKQYKKLNSLGIKCIAIGLSDPDLMESGVLIAQSVDYYFTNSSLALKFYRNNGLANCHHLSFATETIGKPPTIGEKLFDVVIVGGMRKDRIPIVNALTQAGFSVGCFGRSWQSELVPGAFISESVRGDNYYEAIRAGSIYFSFAGTVAGYENVKVGLLDAAAQGSCVVTHDFADVDFFFNRESEILTYKDQSDLINVIAKTLSAPQNYLDVGVNAQMRVQRDHLWQHRWKAILDVLGHGMSGDRITK